MAPTVNGTLNDLATVLGNTNYQDEAASSTMTPTYNASSMIQASFDVIHRNLSTCSSCESTETILKTTAPDGDHQSSDSSILTKITILLVATAVILIVSYKFVVRLFLGYADRKDDVFPDGMSDDEDSAVVKIDPEKNFEIYG